MSRDPMHFSTIMIPIPFGKENGILCSAKKHLDIFAGFFRNFAKSMQEFQETDFSIDLKNKMTSRFTSAGSNTQHVTRSRP